jgi:hypothetical protein
MTRALFPSLLYDEALGDEALLADLADFDFVAPVAADTA